MFAASKTDGSSEVPDPQFNYVTMLLHGDGTNGAQNNTFLDSSTNNFTITRNGNTTQGSFSPYGSNWSNSFNGTNSYLTLSSNASMSFGTSNFTIEGWFFTGDKSVSGGASRTLIGNSGNSYTEQLYISTSGYLTFGNTGSTFIAGSTDLANSTWHHFAISRSGTSTNQIAMWVDGTRVAQGTNSQNYTSGTIYIGAFGASDGFWNGYISNLRIVNGSAVYDPANSTITVPTTPLTAITNTALLTCQANRFFDASSNAYTVTATGTPSVQRFNPFGTSTAYSTSVIGGSGYFDGDGDNLSYSQQTYSGNFTFECWVYQTGSSGSYPLVFASNTASVQIMIDYQGTGKLTFYTSSTTIQSASNVFQRNQWNHLAYVRSGSTVTIYYNGTSVASGSLSDAIPISFIGGYSSSSYTLNGYMSDVRITTSALYTTTFTPPIAPLTAISGTSLLLNYTNGAIFDNAMMNNLETVGNAQISTSVVKYGTGSLKFDGTGDYLKLPYTPNLNFTGNFTVECWVNLTSKVTNFPTIINNYSSFTSNGGFAIFASHNSGTSGKYNVAFNGVFPAINSTTSIAYGTWQHIALVRSGSTLTLYVDGVANGTSTQTANVVGTANNWWVGTAGDDLANGYLNGYIDDLRITKGFARYTANFTPPIAAFPNIGPY